MSAIPGEFHERRLTPTERLHDIARTLAERPKQERSEAIEVKQLSVGATAGKWICDKLALSRLEDETDDEWVERTLRLAKVLHTGMAVMNGAGDPFGRGPTNGGES